MALSLCPKEPLLQSPLCTFPNLGGQLQPHTHTHTPCCDLFHWSPPCEDVVWVHCGHVLWLEVANDQSAPSAKGSVDCIDSYLSRGPNSAHLGNLQAATRIDREHGEWDMMIELIKATVMALVGLHKYKATTAIKNCFPRIFKWSLQPINNERESINCAKPSWLKWNVNVCQRNTH